MVVTTIRDVFKKATNPLGDGFQKIINPYRKAIDNLWHNLPKDERRQIASELKRNEEIIEKYYGPIEDPTDIKKIILSLYRFAYYKGYPLNTSTAIEYIRELKDLDKIIEDMDEIIKNINKGYFSPFNQYKNIIIPNNYRIFAFSIAGKPNKQKKTLREILKAIGNIKVMGYPIDYYGTSNSSMKYYIRFGDKYITIEFFINSDKQSKDYIPPEVAGYLLYLLANILQKRKKSIIPPNKQQYYTIADLFETDEDPNIDNTYANKVRSYFFAYQQFFKINRKLFRL
jgi:hypothetical protein